MKSLSLSKPLVLITIGIPGSGKSFFARQFSETFSAPVVSYDKLRHLLFANSAFNKQEQDLINTIADSEMEELLKTQKTFIIDGGGASKVQRMDLRKKAHAAGYDTLLIWVQTDKNTAKYRSMKRSSRRNDDKYNASLSSEQYDHLEKRFTQPQPTEAVVVISGKHTYPTQAKVVLKKLVTPRAEAAQTIVNHGNRTPDASAPRRNVIIR